MNWAAKFNCIFQPKLYNVIKKGISTYVKEKKNKPKPKINYLKWDQKIYIFKNFSKMSQGWISHNSLM